MSIVFDINRDPANYHHNEELSAEYLRFKLHRRELELDTAKKYLNLGGKVGILYSEPFQLKVLTRDVISLGFTGSIGSENGQILYELGFSNKHLLLKVI